VSIDPTRSARIRRRCSTCRAKPRGEITLQAVDCGSFVDASDSPLTYPHGATRRPPVFGRSSAVEQSAVNDFDTSEGNLGRKSGEFGGTLACDDEGNAEPTQVKGIEVTWKV
jgi:hypothetical protein